MSDPVTAARAARENLARALAGLQMPGVPPQLMAVAEPVAHAMSALHRIEASHGAAVGEAGPAALAAARQALSILQAGAGQHQAVDQALEVIASSLSMIHGLAQPPVVSPFAGTVAGGPAYAPSFPQPAAQPPPPVPATPYGQPAYGQPATPYGQPAYGQPAHGQPAPPTQGQGAWPQAASVHPAPAPPPPHVPPAGAALGSSAAQAARPAPLAPPAGSLRVEAELGAHSSTNFYKGLSGNDVIDSGGIFVSTYQIPEIGQTLSMRVSMPGGYEFEAAGIVRWTREAPDSGSDGQPGYGAQFTQISPEGRQLVYRYVRNREPLFHDDL